MLAGHCLSWLVAFLPFPSLLHFPCLRAPLSTSRFCLVSFLSRADWDAIVKLTEGFNGADMRNVCTEAGMMAIRDDRDWVVEEDFTKAARKIAETKKLESKLDYAKV